jgi:hypothetical protein
MTILLAAIWSPSIPVPEEFRSHAVVFASAEDCDAAAKKWLPDLAAAAVDRKHFLKWDNWGDKAPPADVSITYSCVEKDEGILDKP